MMQRDMTITLIALLMLGFVTASVADVERPSVSGWQHDDTAIGSVASQRGMFDGVKLTGQQRQYMRDLMQQARQDAPVLNVNDIEKLHSLAIAENFDQPAVRAQITNMMQAQIERQIEMTRVRNQMYNLLSNEQKAALEQSYQQQIKELRRQLSLVDPLNAPSVAVEHRAEKE